MKSIESQTDKRNERYLVRNKAIYTRTKKQCDSCAGSILIKIGVNEILRCKGYEPGMLIIYCEQCKMDKIAEESQIKTWSFHCPSCNKNYCNNCFQNLKS